MPKAIQTASHLSGIGMGLFEIESNQAIIKDKCFGRDGKQIADDAFWSKAIKGRVTQSGSVKPSQEIMRPIVEQDEHFLSDKGVLASLW